MVADFILGLADRQRRSNGRGVWYENHEECCSCKTQVIGRTDELKGLRRGHRCDPRLQKEVYRTRRSELLLKDNDRYRPVRFLQ